MKIISLLQPWGQLFVQGLKTVETRSWSTNHRGPVFIHASGVLNKKMQNIGISPLEMAQSNEHFIRCIADPTQMQFGKIIGMVNIDEVFKVENEPPPAEFFEKLTIQELAFGNYELGRYMWFSSKAVEFKRPIVVKGTQGLREYTGTTHCMYCDQGHIPVKGVHEFERKGCTCANVSNF